MQASTSQPIFCNNKAAKNKYQKIRANEKLGNTTSVEVKSVSCDAKDKSKDSLELVDLKDFPELKALGKQGVKFDLQSFNCGSKSVKSWSSAVSSGYNKNFKDAFPALSDVKNSGKKNEGLILEKNNMTHLVADNVSALMKINSELIDDKSVNTNVHMKENKINSSKITSRQLQKNHLKKKRTDPVLINFQDILTINKSQRRRVKHPSIAKCKIQKHKNKELLSGNILDSSNPIRSRGKQREIKKKKLSKFKTTIIKERIIKHRMRERKVDGYFESESFNIINEADFKTEIKDYLNKLSERKLTILESSKGKLNQNASLENNDKERKLTSLESSKGKLNQNASLENNDKERKEKVNTELNSNTEGHIKIPVKNKKIPQICSEKGIKFSSKFREYCDNIITPELNSSMTELIKEVIELQDRLFLRDPVRAKAKKRHVSGIREVRKYLNLKKVKMVIIAPNLEKLQMEGSVYDSIDELKSMAGSQNVPYAFVLDRYKLGKCTKKNVPVSAFGILNYEGLEGLYENALHQLLEAKRLFSELAVPKEVVENTEKINDVTSELISHLVSAFREELKISGEDSLT